MPEENRSTPNPNAFRVRDSVAIPCEADEGNKEAEKPVESEEEVIMVTSVGENNGLQNHLKSIKTPPKIQKKRKKITKKLSEGGLTTQTDRQAEPVLLELETEVPAETFKDAGESSTSAVTSPSMDELLPPFPALLSPLPGTPCQDEAPTPGKRGRTDDTEESMLEPQFRRPRKVPHVDSRAYEVLTRMIANDETEEGTTEVLREEFSHLRKDNSHHAMQLRAAMTQLVVEVRECKSQTSRLIVDISRRQHWRSQILRCVLRCQAMAPNY